MRYPLFLFGLLLALIVPASGADDLVITEFMASNSRTRTDEDGAYSDWIEVFNASTNTVSAGGWHLTDSASQLTKWQFPATNIPPHGFLLVWASGKNRRVPGAPLHTSFSLSASGEYLALVRPDGVTVATGFSPQFPEQFTDVPYGFPMNGTFNSLVATGAGARALVPSGSLGTAWRGAGFDDSAWLSGPTDLGYDQSTNYLPTIGLDIGAGMSNANASAYLRVPFTVADPSVFKALTLRMRYDDGFVAYLNGTEVARRNAPASPDWNSTATAVHGASPSGSMVQNFDTSGTTYTATTGATAPGPAVQAAGAGTSGQFLRLCYDGTGSAANIIAFNQATPGLFQTIIASFDVRMTNSANNPADGMAFMLIPTSAYGANGPGLTGIGGVEEPNFAGVFGIGLDMYPHGTQNDVSAHWNGSERLNVTVPKTTVDLANGIFHRVQVTLQHVTGGARVTVVITPDINGAPGAPYTPISNLYIAGLDPYESRLEFAARTGGAFMNVDLDNISAQFIPTTGVVPTEEFDISASASLLAAGTNLLAVHGLNFAAVDTDFLIGPGLVGSDFSLSTNADFISPATPGVWNNVSGAGALPAVTFSPPSGLYFNAVTVSLASVSSSVQIRYTLDGTAPTAASLLYSNPLVVSVNGVVRARAFEAGRIDGPLSAGNYLIIDNTLTNFSSNLPLIFVDTLGIGLAADNKTPGYAVFINTNESRPRISFNSPVDHAGRVGIEYHGQSSLGFPKKSFNIEMTDEQDNDQRVGLLGQPKGADWVLLASYTDKTLMNDILTYDLSEALGHYAVRRRFVEVFVRSTAGKLGYGDYLGVFAFLEKIRIDENRVNISKPQSGATNDPITGGYIWKRDKGGTTNDSFFTTSRQTSTDPLGEALRYHDPKIGELSALQRAWLTNHLNEFENVLYGANWRDPVNGYAKYIDVGSYVDHHWSVEFAKNIDGIRISNYLQKDRGGKIKEEPLWDWNLAWGNANYLGGALTNGWYFTQLAEAQDMYFRRLRTDPDFYQLIVDRWGRMRTNTHSLSNILGRVSAYTNLLNEAQARDHIKWPRLSAYVWPNPDGANLVPTGTDGTTANWDVNYSTPGTYSALIGEMKRWITGRFAWVDSQFIPSPGLTRDSGGIIPGATVSITGGLGSVYYTLDGTDPRASNGVASAAARLYSGAITLTNNAGLFARAFHTNGWSPPARAVYVVTTPALRLTEIMYHPDAPPTNSPYATDDFEFVEIKNTGSNAINLLNCELQGGVEFKFPSFPLAPGAHALVVQNRAAFLTRYPSNAYIAGEFTGKLNNAGDHIVLLGPYGEPIHDLSYGDNWHPVTDQWNFSLAIRDPAGPLAAWNISAGWRASGALGGSPGTNDPAVFLPPVLVNEVLASSVLPDTDWIELFNPTATNVDVGGWFLSDSFSAPKKFRIPGGTVIPAGGFVTFTEADFNPLPLASNSFALSAEGDDVWLFSASASSNLTGYANGFDFGASDEGVTFGRHVMSDGNEDFVALSAPTFGATNTLPRVGPLVVSEIMYHPPEVGGADNQLDEFIELRNITGADVPLYSSVFPDGTWRLREAVDFDFPTNLTLAAGARLLVVGFHPTNAATLDAFRARYSVDPGVLILGPWSGKLDNSGERIELHRPGVPTTNGLPYLLVEKTTYSHTSPWNPAADGVGPSLQRIALDAYGNDPANWTATMPTAGAGVPAGSPPVILTQPVGFSTLAFVNTNLSLVATGESVRYQWIFNGSPIPGATNATLLLSNIQTAQSGSYLAVVYTPSGSVLSVTVQVQAVSPVLIVTQPLSHTGPSGTNVTFSVVASGTGTLRYQWSFNGTSLTNATNATFSLTNARLPQHGLYAVRVTDNISTVESIPAQLYILVRPGVVVFPAPTTVVQGQSVTLTCVATGAAPIHYRWLRNNTTYVAQTTSTNITIASMQTNTLFRLAITNLAGSTSTTNITVTVLRDSDGDGVPDNWEIAHGMITNSAADGLLDSDNDGMINRDEYFAGTRPNDSNSVLRVSMLFTKGAPLQFTAQSNIIYTIQYRTNLDGSVWQTLSNVPPAPGERAILFESPPGTTNGPRYFKVLVPPLP